MARPNRPNRQGRNKPPAYKMMGGQMTVRTPGGGRSWLGAPETEMGSLVPLGRADNGFMQHGYVPIGNYVSPTGPGGTPFAQPGLGRAGFADEYGWNPVGKRNTQAWRSMLGTGAYSTYGQPTGVFADKGIQPSDKTPFMGLANRSAGNMSHGPTGPHGPGPTGPGGAPAGPGYPQLPPKGPGGKGAGGIPVTDGYPGGYDSQLDPREWQGFQAGPPRDRTPGGNQQPAKKPPNFKNWSEERKRRWRQNNRGPGGGNQGPGNGQPGFQSGEFLPMTPGYEADWRLAEDQYAETLGDLAYQRSLIPGSIDMFKARQATDIGYDTDSLMEQMAERGLVNSGPQDYLKMRDITTPYSRSAQEFGLGIQDALNQMAGTEAEAGHDYNAMLSQALLERAAEVAQMMPLSLPGQYPGRRRSNRPRKGRPRRGNRPRGKK